MGKWKGEFEGKRGREVEFSQKGEELRWSES